MARGLSEDVFWRSTIEEVDAVFSRLRDLDRAEDERFALIVADARNTNPYLKSRKTYQIEDIIGRRDGTRPDVLESSHVERLARMARGEIRPGEGD